LIEEPAHRSLSKAEREKNRRVYRFWLVKPRSENPIAKTAQVLAVFGILLLCWWLVAIAVNKPLIVPSPPEVFIRLLSLISEGGFWLSVAASLGRILVGFCLGMMAGTLFAFVMYRVHAVHVTLSPLIRIIQATPIVSFIIIALIWTPTNLLPVLISGLMVFPVAWSNISTGLKNIDTSVLEMASAFRIPRTKMIRHVFFPALRPNFNAAIMSGIGLAWKSGVTAEVLALPLSAIGREIYQAKIYLETPDLFAWTIVVVILSISLEFAFKQALLRRRAKPFGKTADYQEKHGAQATGVLQTSQSEEGRRGGKDGS